MLDAPTLAELSGLGIIRRLARGATFMWESEPVTHAGTVITGALRLVMQQPDGDERTVGIAMRGDFIGRPFGGNAPYSAVAYVDSTICVADGQRFDDLTCRAANLGAALLGKVSDELDRTRRWLVLLGRRSAMARVAALLDELAARGGTQPGDPTRLPLTRGEMADLLGLTIETVSRKLHVLARAKVIALPDRHSLVILDPTALRDAS